MDGEAQLLAAVEGYKWGVPLTNLLSNRPYIMPMGDPLYHKCSPKEGSSNSTQLRGYSTPTKGPSSQDEDQDEERDPLIAMTSARMRPWVWHAL